MNHEDPRPPYQQVAAQLRAAILAGEYAEGERLPSQVQIAEKFGVARMTAQQALRILREQNLISSRTGSGNFVRPRQSRPVGLRPHIEEALREQDVTIDFYGYTAETLAGALTEPLDKVRSGQFPVQRIRARLLVLDTDREQAVPARAGDRGGDEPQLRQRMADTTERAVRALRGVFEELVDLGMLEAALLDVRIQPVPPMQKVYVLNRRHVFWGYYPLQERTITIGRKKIAAIDPAGKDATLFQQSASATVDDQGSQFVSATLEWFENIWQTLGQPYDLA